jgi:aspartate-semialdehyde dehydrogenase
MRVAVVGATGMVGQEMLKVLAEYNFPITELYPVASEKSIGKELNYQDKKYSVIGVEQAISLKPDLALFSAGGDFSLRYAPMFTEVGTVVIDNSSAWRMHPEVKLIVPEVNGDELTKGDKLIANPNCSTIQLVMALKPLHDLFGLKRVLVSTYQSISGTGVKAVEQMNAERSGSSGEMVYPYAIDKNCLPHCDVFLENDYTKEEMKLVHEPKKILGAEFGVSATAVRVPVEGGHSEAVNIEFHKEFDITALRTALADFPGVKVQDNPLTKTYPMPLYARGKNEVFVGRIRRDESQKNTVNLWIVADNIRKGAATNAVQIAKKVFGV